MASTSSAQASVGFLSAADDLLTKLLLDYSIFNEPRLDGRATGKMMRFARELRMSDKEVASARELVDKVSLRILLSVRKVKGSAEAVRTQEQGRAGEATGLGSAGGGREAGLVEGQSGERRAPARRAAHALTVPTQRADVLLPLVMIQLRQGVVSVPDGLDTLLNLPCVKTFNQKWDDEPLFAHHAKRYIIALRPDSGIAFHETDRYKNPRGLSRSRPMPPPVAAKLRRDPSTFIEVGVFATRAFKKGEVVNLRGGIADLTEEEDDEMRDEGGRSDFSVLWSQRKECFCLLLGPARFVNHDCRNNVEFQLTGTNMAFKVLEDVAKDEELFTHYGASLSLSRAPFLPSRRAAADPVVIAGEHYFEHDNASCLCATCEQCVLVPAPLVMLAVRILTLTRCRLKQGAFAPARPKAAAAPKPRASSPTPASRRSRRASTIAAPDYNEARSSASTSATAAAAAPRAGRAAGLSRSASTPTLSGRASARPRPRSSRMNPTRGELSPADALRGQPRLIVQPKLAPPPGYARDYEWDPKKRVARYMGPKTSSVSENAASSKADSKRKPDSAPASSASTSTSAAAPAKRGRPRSSTAAANESSPAPSAASSPRKAKKPRVSQVVLKQVRVGERSSKRQAALGKEPTSARIPAQSTKLRQVTALGRADEVADSSDLSEAEDGADEDEAMDEAAAVEAQEEDEVEAMLSPVRHARGPSSSSKAGPASPLPFAMPASTRYRAESPTSVALSAAPTRSSRSLTSDTSASAAAPSSVALRSVVYDVGMSTSTPIEESHSPQLRGASLEDDLEDDKDALPARKGQGQGKGEPDAERDEPAAPRQPISAPMSNFYGALGVGDSASSDSGGGGGAAAGAGAPSQADFRSGPSQEGGPRNASRLVAGSSSGGGGGGAGGDDGDGRRPLGGRVPVDMMDEEEEEEKPKTGEEEDGQEQGKGGAAAPSGDVQAASEGAPAVEEEGRARAAPSDPEDAAAALLMLLCAPCVLLPPFPSLHHCIELTCYAPTARRRRRRARPHRLRRTPPTRPTRARRPRRAPRRAARVRQRGPTCAGAARRTSRACRPARRSTRARLGGTRSCPSRPSRRRPSPTSRRRRRHRCRGRARRRRASRRPSLRRRRASGVGPPRAAAPRRQRRRRAGLPHRRRSRRGARGRSPFQESSPTCCTRPRRSPRPEGTTTRRAAVRPLPLSPAPHPRRAQRSLLARPADISKFEATRDPSHNPLPPRRPSPTPDPTPSPSPPPPPARKLASVAKPSRPSTRPPAVAAAAAPSTPRAAPVASTSRAPTTSSGSSARAPAAAPSSAPPEGVRSTRRSFPIAGPLRDLIYSPAAVAANGGWDAAAGKYVSATTASSAASPAPLARRASSALVDGGATSSSSRRKRPASPAGPPTSTAAPPADVRSTRRSFPMAGTRMADLVYSPAARLVSGGWDPVLGRYVSAAKGEPTTGSRAGGASTPHLG